MGWSWQWILDKKIDIDNGLWTLVIKVNYFVSWFTVVSLGTPLDDQPKEPEVTNPEAVLQEIEDEMSLPGKMASKYCNPLIKIIHIHLKEVYEF